MPLTDATKFLSPVYNASTCSCQNILLEAHYIAYYNDYGDTFNTSFKINNVTLDLIYGDYTPASCSSPVNFKRKNSITFKNSIYSRYNSGGPGYLKGMKLLVGSANETANGTYINVSTNGFQLRGADNQGLCYNIKTSISTGFNVTSYLIENYTEQMYFDDPAITFKESQVYGCKYQLNRTGLQEFC